MRKASTSGARPNLVLPLAVYISLALLLYSFNLGAMGDHRHYIEQWSLLLSGQNPWSTDNTYGPFHTVLGFLLPINVLAPKLFMIGLLLAANLMLLSEMIGRSGLSRHFIVYILAIPTNVLFISLTLAHAMNDALAAAFFVFAIVARLRGKDLIVALFVAMAALTKYYPILLLPFFALDREDYRWRILIAGVALFALGMAGSYLIWGDPLINSIIYGGSRGASGYSLLLDLSRHGFDNLIVGILFKYNAVAVLVTVSLVLIFSVVCRLSWLEGAVVAYLAMLIMYKVGHSQFFLPWLFLVSALPLLNSKRAATLSLIFAPTLLYLSYYQFSMDLGTNLLGNRPYWIEFYAGFVSAPFFIIPLVVAIGFLVKSRNEPVRLIINS
jgi:hypothetical protein